MKKGIVLVANDAAPSQILDLISNMLMENCRYLQIYPFLACGKDFPSDLEVILSHVSSARAVVVGMSSSEELAKEEIAVAKEALEIGIPVFCCSDTFGLRPHFDVVLSNRITTLFCINQKQAEQARKKYPNLKVVVTGNPMWEKFFFQMSSRAQSRTWLKVTPNDTVILCPGGKDTIVNIIHFNAAIECCGVDKSCHLIISTHPGDKTPPHVYQSLVDFAPSNVKVRIISTEFLSATEILSGADCVFSSASTIDIEALCRDIPIPIISFLSPIAKRRLKKVTGSDKYELVEMSVAYEYGYNSNLDLHCLIHEWKHLGESSDYILRVRRHFSIPEKRGVVIDKMVSAILN